MNLDRRQFMGTSGLGLAAGMVAGSAHASENGSKVKVGICDWNIRDENNRGGNCRPELIPYVKKAHLEGIQVSVATNPSNVPLRDPKVRQQYIELGKKHGIKFPSVAAGSILNSIPLATEPQSAVYVIDAVEAAAALGSTNILMAFFGNGDLRLKDSQGRFRIKREEPFRLYELDTKSVSRVVEALRQIAPRAEDAGIALGLENTISAEQNLDIIDQVGSDILQVYYDLGNSTSNGYDVPGELRMLGNDRICEIHLKDNGQDVREFTSPNLQVDWPAVAEALKDIGYDKWYVIEESGRNKRFMEDTQANVKFAKELLA